MRDSLFSLFSLGPSVLLVVVVMFVRERCYDRYTNSKNSVQIRKRQKKNQKKVDHLVAVGHVPGLSLPPPCYCYCDFPNQNGPVSLSSTIDPRRRFVSKGRRRAAPVDTCPRLLICMIVCSFV